MSPARDVHVSLLPSLAPPEQLQQGVAVVIDVLRSTTSIVHALAAGCTSIIPCIEVDDAVELASEMESEEVVLAGERGGLPLAGFDLGNSPKKFNAQTCQGRTLILTTSNGSTALMRGAEAQRCLVAAFVNYSAVCEQILSEKRPLFIICSGTEGDVTLEDTLLAGALVDCLAENQSVQLNDGARLAWDCFETHGPYLESALRLSRGGTQLCKVGLEEDIESASRVDAHNFVPELRSDPLRIEMGNVGIAASHWNP